MPRNDTASGRGVNDTGVDAAADAASGVLGAAMR
jgi:hypothetical protein